MRRMPSSFYKELAVLRDKFGETEYSRDQLLPAVMGLISKYLKDERDLLRDAANGILDSVEKSDDGDQPGLFPYEQHTSLGEKKRIKRGKMNISQHDRRKRVIDHNKTGQDRAWAAETAWLNEGVDQLKGKPETTTRDQVLSEDGKANGRAKAKRK